MTENKRTASPFGEADFTRILSEFRLPGVDVEQMLASHRRNIEAVTAANQLILEGVQAVGRRQAEILRQTLEEARTAMGDLVTPASPAAPEEKIARHADLMKVAFEKALNNMKELAEMISKSNAEAAEKISKRVGESIDELKQTAVKMKR